MTNPAALDFEKIELMRERMELTIKDMATLLGVSRATYYKWVSGGPIRRRSEQRVRDTLRQLLPLIKSGAWPPPGARHWKGDERIEALLELLAAEG